MLRLPLGISTFSKLRKNNLLYVDKTEHAYNLITNGYRYFLSRPRRFGKSLFVSTLKEILAGNKGLFNGLWISNSNYQWHKHGVITLDFSSIEVTSADDFRIGVCQLLQDIADDYSLNLTVNPTKPDSALRMIARALFEQFGHVAILIDEYDNPILQVLNISKKADEVRKSLRTFFTVIKSLDSFIDFVFITGVSSFAKAGLFSGINNLSIITMDSRYATLCGYTDGEIDHYFTDHLMLWSQKEKLSYDNLRHQIKEWYNGYHFSANAPSVYNPFSITSTLDAQQFKNFWFQSGAPTFLIEELAKDYRKKEHHLFYLEKFETTEDSLGIFEIGATPLPALMFQTGYLTITNFDRVKNSYELGYPNLEVKIALQKQLLKIYTTLDFAHVENIALQLFTALNSQNLPELITLLKQLLVRVPYQIHIKEEKFYHALLQVIFGAAGIKTQSESSISHGRIDLVLELPATLYIIEVKFNKSPQEALAQIDNRKYYEACLHDNKPVVLLGLSFIRKPKSFEILYAAKSIPFKKN